MGYGPWGPKELDVTKRLTYFPSSIFGYLLTWGARLLVSYLFAFSCCPRGSPGKNTGVGCHSLLQGATFCQKSAP